MWKISRNDKLNSVESWYVDGCSYITARDENGKVLCRATYGIYKDIMYLCELETDEDSRRQGIAGEVLTYLHTYAHEYGVKGAVCRILAQSQSLLPAEILLGRFGYSMPEISEEMVTLSVAELKKSAIAREKLVELKGVKFKNVLPEEVKDLLGLIDGIGDSRDVRGMLNSRLSYQYEENGHKAFMIVSAEDNNIVLEGLYVDPALDRRIAVMLLSYGIKGVTEKYADDAVISMSLISNEVKDLAVKMLDGADYTRLYLLDSVRM